MFFSFSHIDKEKACDYGHMTHHRMWYHRPRLEEKEGKKDELKMYVNSMSTL